MGHLEELAEETDPLTGFLARDVSDYMPDISPVSSQTIFAAILGPNYQLPSSSLASSTAGTAKSVQGQAQGAPITSGTSSEGTQPIV